MSDENDMLTMTALGRFEPGDIDPEAFHVLLTGSPRAVGRAGQFLGEAVELTTAATLARADALDAALKRTEANRDAAMEDAAEEYARAERAEALLAEAVEALKLHTCDCVGHCQASDALSAESSLCRHRNARATLAKLEAKP